MKHWQKFSRKVENVPSLKVSEVRLDGAWSKLEEGWKENLVLIWFWRCIFDLLNITKSWCCEREGQVMLPILREEIWKVPWFFRDRILVHILWCHGKHRNQFRSILLHMEKEKQVYITAKQLFFILKIWLNQSNLFYFFCHGREISLYNGGIFSNVQIKEYNPKTLSQQSYLGPVAQRIPRPLSLNPPRKISSSCPPPGIGISVHLKSLFGGIGIYFDKIGGKLSFIGVV